MQQGHQPTGRTNRRGALQVYDALREDILWLRIRPGSALDEMALAARFEISRTPVREALLLLSGEGFVHFLPNRTSIVAPMLLNNVGDYLDTFLVLSRAVARSAATSALADEDMLADYLENYRAAIGDGDFEKALRTDNAFRRRLAGLTGNMFQMKYFDQVLDAGVRTKIMYYFPNATGGELRASCERLEELAGAVVGGDANASDARMSELIRAEFAIVIRSLEPKFANEMPMDEHPVTVGDLA